MREEDMGTRGRATAAALDTNNFGDGLGINNDTESSCEQEIAAEQKIKESAKEKDFPGFDNKNENANGSASIFKAYFGDTVFQISTAAIRENGQTVDIKIDAWCDNHPKPKSKKMMQLARFSVTGDNDELQFSEAGQLPQNLIDFSNAAVSRLRNEGVLKEAKESRATLFVCHSLWNNFNAPLELRNKQVSENPTPTPTPKEAEVLPETYEEVIKQMADLPRQEGVLRFVEWIKTCGTYYEARACEVAGEKRTKKINAEKIKKGQSIESKKSISVRMMRGIPHLIEKSGTNKPRYLGQKLPDGYDTSQVSISEQAEILFGL